jgi:hypothetical protein
MSSQPQDSIAHLTLRHWTIDSRQFVGGAERPARSLPYSEPSEGGQSRRLASKLAKVKSDLARLVP